MPHACTVGGSAARGNPRPQRISRHHEGADKIWKHTISHASNRTGSKDYVHRIAALQRADGCQRPPTLEAVTFEGQIVDGVDHESMTGIKIGTALAAEDIRAVLHHKSVIGTRYIIDRVRPSVGSIQLQTVRH